MKKGLKQVVRIFLALILAFILYFIGMRVYWEVEFRRVAYAPLPKSTEECISDFNANKEKFEAVKDYMLTKDEDFYLNSKNYLEKVQDENVKLDLEFIFTQLEYSVVTQRDPDGVCFEYKSTRLTGAGIIYSKDLDLPALYMPSSLGGDWYEYFIGHSYDENPFEKIPPAFRWTIYFIFSIGLYLVLGLIPPFKKRKLPIDV